MTDQFEYLKEEKSECLSSLESEISFLKEKHDITPYIHPVYQDLGFLEPFVVP